MLNYAVHAENKSLYNTPRRLPSIRLASSCNGFSLRVASSPWGVPVFERPERCMPKSIERGFYRGPAAKSDRSLMNVTFRLATEELDKRFVSGSHCRRSRWAEGSQIGRRNACIDLQRISGRGCDALVDFMKEFERRNG